ncbi:hypothetical protein QWY85_20560 [Neolewinella lacunae]|uniref:Uncharacterized protein n=1 Tax=Neolewinella lacunae TaxID=1517758 RepID=A0A923T7S6_9BACT|nr:hypothetical protein [Neolewinella lacunae]MBC6993864.1 hypothetical protein [Neolewinella lacunae]MDN3637075.1 hypothetical protein [Neolewinella lacunae]
MSIWDTLFNRAPAYDPAEGPNFRFGRYTDAYKSPENYVAWDASLTAFENGDYLESCASFMAYLRDEQEDNVKWHREDEKLYFEFYQGSKRVTGFADAGQLRASADIAMLKGNNADLLHRLTSLNYEMKYSRFAIKGQDCLSIVFDTPTNDASPYKLYHALKEMALNADKQDDLLLDEFSEYLSPTEVTHLRELSPEDKARKLEFLRSRIQGVIDHLAAGRINPEEQPGAVAYLLLDLVYRLDYLLIPEGYTMEALERMHRMYFAREEDQPVTYKNIRLLSELQHLLRRAPESFAQELYAGKSTFGITLPANHDRLANLIDNELPNMDWYQDNSFPTVAQAIPGYVVGYALFNYAVPPPDRDLLQLYYRICENEYFRGLGYKQQFLERDGRPARRAIRAAISDIAERHSATYPRLRPGLSQLNFSNLLDFGRSYLFMIRELDLSKP